MKAAATDYLNNQTTDTSAYDLVHRVMTILLYNYPYSIKLTVTTMIIIPLTQFICQYLLYIHLQKHLETKILGTNT